MMTRLRKALQAVEWGSCDGCGNGRFCALCQAEVGFWDDSGWNEGVHKPGCLVGDALKEAEAGEPMTVTHWVDMSGALDSKDRRQLTRLVIECVREFPDDGKVDERFSAALSRAASGMAEQDESYWTIRNREEKGS